MTYISRGVVIDARHLFARRPQPSWRGDDGLVRVSTRSVAMVNLCCFMPRHSIAELRRFAEDVVRRSRGDGPTRIRKTAARLGAWDSTRAADLVLGDLLVRDCEGDRR